MGLKDCYNFEDFRKIAKKKLPEPIFHYIDGGSDDELTLKRNTESFSKWKQIFAAGFLDYLRFYSSVCT